MVRRTDAGAESVSLVDFDNIEQLAPEVSWFYQMPLHALVRDPLGASRPLAAAEVSSGYFDQLGLVAVRGSLIPQAEGSPAVILSHRVWHETYGADETIVGTLLDFDGGPAIPSSGSRRPISSALAFAGLLGLGY